MTAVFMLFILVLLSCLAYVNFSGHDTARWHQSILAQEDKDMDGGAVRLVPYSDANFESLVKSMQALPRSKQLAGSLESQHLTFVTRTKWVGFPDYTTIERVGDDIRIFARLRFGKKDIGVNAARVERLKQVLD